MEAKSPVIAGSPAVEVVYGGGQVGTVTPPMPGLMRQADAYGRVLTRWEPTEEERRHIADGGSVYVMVYTFNTPMQPFLPLTVVPEDFQYALPPEEWPERLGEEPSGDVR